MHPLLNIALQAARKAGSIIARAVDRLDTLHIREKQKNDFVTEIDQKSEQIIIDLIRKNYPDHGIIGEESGTRTGNNYTWIIDPLDGTTNFIHGFPHFCISIAIQYKNKTEHGLIYDPLRQEIFSASKGEGAKLNDYRIRVSSQQDLDGAFLATGLPFRHNDRIDIHMAALHKVAKITGDVRRAGSAALDLAYVAAGRLDGYWESGLALWDIAAGAFIVKEAGGLVSDFDGQEHYIKSGNIVAANAKVLKGILQQIRPVFAKGQ